MKAHVKILAVCFLLFSGMTGRSQVTVPACPPNIGFESGDFTGWECYGGLASEGSLSFSSQQGQIPGRHTIITGSEFAQLDPYGNFPVICPNGSLYSVMLGNSQTGRGAEKLSYTFTVPANVTEYSLIYNYAVVFENPAEHSDPQQPKFTAKLYDIASGRYEVCGSFEFVSSSVLPGFQLSAIPGNRNGGGGGGGGGGGIPAEIYYKPWSAVTIDLSDYAGKTVRLEFTTNDCTRGGHFGYAYIDVNENCASQVTGNTICPGETTSLTLNAPFGFREYYWYNAASDLIGTGDKLFLQPIPPVGTQYSLRIVPYQGYGCEETLYTTIERSDEGLELVVPESITGCVEDGVDITNAVYVSGSTPTFKYTYHNDAAGLTFINNPRRIMNNGIYYIKGTIASGCSIIKPVTITLINKTQLTITQPAPVCVPSVVNITLPAVTAGSDPDAVLTYWLDPDASESIPNPAAITQSGTYYIRAIADAKCVNMKPVFVSIGTIPVVLTTDLQACLTANLTASSVTANSTPGLQFTYWTDVDLTIPLSSPQSVTLSGTYYIKGTTSLGCYNKASVSVVIYKPINPFTSNPAPVIYPATVDLTVYATDNLLVYSYWRDAKASIPLTNPSKVGITGTYYLKIVNGGGCTGIYPVKVLIHPPEEPVVTSINTFTPNSDGVNDEFKLDITGYLRVNYFRIYNRWGIPVFETADINQPWNGKTEGKDAPGGTYYWVFDSFDDFRKKEVKRSGYITVVR